MGFAPLVKVTEQAAFEEFAYNYFDSRPDFPPNVGMSPFGRGIWRMQPGTNGTMVRVHDNDDSTKMRGILLPILQIDNHRTKS